MSTRSFKYPKKELLNGSAPPNSKLTPKSIKKSNFSLLVVDDDDMVRTTVATALRICGYRVSTANNGFEALKILESPGAKIDMLILDLTMPKVSGKDVLLELRNRACKLPVILMSGYGKAARKETLPCRKYYLDFLSKPFKLDVLISKIRTALDEGVEAA